MSNSSAKYPFTDYPFPKNLIVNIKNGHYLVMAADGETEVLQADNAKDALDKTKLKNIIKLEYLGFHKKVILDAAELVEGVLPEQTTVAQENAAQSEAAPPEVEEEQTEKDEKNNES